MIVPFLTLKSNTHYCHKCMDQDSNFKDFSELDGGVVVRNSDSFWIFGKVLILYDPLVQGHKNPAYRLQSLLGCLKTGKYLAN